MPKVSIILPAYNEETRLAKCLDQLLIQNFSDFELLIIDNNSIDSTKEIIEKYNKKDQRIRYLFEERRSRGAARNRGIEEANGEIIAMIDADCLAPTDWLFELTKPIREGNWLAVQGFQTDPIKNYWTSNIQNNDFDFFWRHYDQQKKSIDLIDTKNFAIKTKIAKDFKFDPDIKNMEDFEFKLRLLRQYSVLFLPNITVDHFHQNSLLNYFRRSIDRGYWIMAIYLRHKTTLSRQKFKLEPMFQTISITNFLMMPFWLLSKILTVGPKKAFFSIVSEISWRIGIIKAFLDKKFLTRDIAKERPWWEKQLFKLKLGKLQWGTLRITLYQKLNNKFQHNHFKGELKDISDDEPKKISVIITTRNRLSDLKKYALASLKKIIFDHDWEIVIINNNSSDGTDQYLSNIASDNIIIGKQNKIGASAGRNRGIALAGGDIIAFIDDDCEVDEFWLQRIYDFYQSKANYLLGQGAVYDTKRQKVVNQEKIDDKTSPYFYDQFYEGNSSFKRELFNYISFNESMTYGFEGRDLISQISLYWPEFNFYYDPQPINHHSAASEYRKEGEHQLTKKGEKNDRKHHLIWQVNQFIRKRNIKIYEKKFAIKFIFLETIFLPFDLLICPHLMALIKTKIEIFHQLNKLRHFKYFFK